MNTSKAKNKSKILRGTENNQPSANAEKCRRKFLRFFPKGFQDEKYVAWERGYKWQAHEKWNAQLNRAEYQLLLRTGEFAELAARAVKIESPTNLIFSFEKLALRDAVRSPEGARLFAEGLDEFLHGTGQIKNKFERWLETVGRLPKKQSRVLTYPIVTVFGFIAQPKRHIFLKPKVTQAAARAYGFDFQYQSKLSWETYVSLFKFAEFIKDDIQDLQPRDMIDVQSFIWVLGSSEYE
ncbi:MAG: hypothetical protein M3388_06800 [Acidobacteriota bacterium]|nr:hypothetical protein [Acidobacteriota bacterium]